MFCAEKTVQQTNDNLLCAVVGIFMAPLNDKTEQIVLSCILNSEV